MLPGLQWTTGRAVAAQTGISTTSMVDEGGYSLLHPRVRVVQHQRLVACEGACPRVERLLENIQIYSWVWAILGMW